MTLTVEVLLRRYLQENGYDGLCSLYCGCGTEEIAPCGVHFMDCVPAYECDFDSGEKITGRTSFKELIIEQLRAEGFNGLINHQQRCRCSLSSMAECSHIQLDCEALK